MNAIDTPRADSHPRTNAEWHRHAAAQTPAGVHSNARLVGADVVFSHGAGPFLFDVEGSRHVDYMLGRGPAFLGHTPTAVNDAVAAAVGMGLTLGSGTTLEVEASELALQVIPWADQIRFTSSGTEAVQAAFRLARAATGRTLIVQFEGLYHGWLDGVSLVAGSRPDQAAPATAGQIPNSGQHSLVVPWNDPDAASRVFAEFSDRIAAVITEPVSVFGGELPQPGYLAHLRSLCDRYGAVLIFDEVVTGFRLVPGSCADLLGVRPDLATYAKAMGSGWPVSAVAGTADMFDGVSDDRVRLSGTYNGNNAAMAAVIATVRATADGTLHAGVARWAQRLRVELERTAALHRLPVTTEGFDQAFWLVVDGLQRRDSDALVERLGLLLRRHRVIQYHHTWLPSAAHDDDALEQTIEAFDRALGELLA